VQAFPVTDGSRPGWVVTAHLKDDWQAIRDGGWEIVQKYEDRHRPQPVTHLGLGRARVEKVASNQSVQLSYDVRGTELENHVTGGTRC
jgi:hypothetical protein